MKQNRNIMILQSVGYAVCSITANGQKILDANLFNFNYPVYVTRPNDTTAVFYSTKMSDYVDNTDTFYINLKPSK